MSAEKLIINTSILFVSISSVIGLSLGEMTGQYRVAYINLGKMLYYSLPFIVASFWAFLSIIAEKQSIATVYWVRKLAWSFYLTGFIFIIILAALASQTEVVPEGFILMMNHMQTIFWEFISAGIIFAGLLIIRVRRKRWIVLATLTFCFGILLMASGTFQTSKIERADVATLEDRYAFFIVDIELKQAQQISGKLESINKEARFDYFLMEETEFIKVNASGEFFAANSLAQNFFVTQDVFLKTVQNSSKYFLVIKNEYFLGNNVTYSLEVYTTESGPSFVGFLLITVSVSGLCSYVSAKGEQTNEEKTSAKTHINENKNEGNYFEISSS
jgi:hypothetical protein